MGRRRLVERGRRQLGGPIGQSLPEPRHRRIQLPLGQIRGRPCERSPTRDVRSGELSQAGLGKLDAGGALALSRRRLRVDGDGLSGRSRHRRRLQRPKASDVPALALVQRTLRRPRPHGAEEAPELLQGRHLAPAPRGDGRGTFVLAQQHVGMAAGGAALDLDGPRGAGAHRQRLQPCAPRASVSQR